MAVPLSGLRASRAALRTAPTARHGEAGTIVGMNYERAGASLCFRVHADDDAGSQRTLPGGNRIRTRGPTEKETAVRGRSWSHLGLGPDLNWFRFSCRRPGLPGQEAEPFCRGGTGGSNPVPSCAESERTVLVRTASSISAVGSNGDAAPMNPLLEVTETIVSSSSVVRCAGSSCKAGRSRSSRLRLRALRRPRLVDQAAIGIERVEIARPAQQQRVLDRPFQMAVRTFDRAVLMRQAPIVAGRLHAIMRAQRLVPARLILPRFPAAECSGRL